MSQYGHNSGAPTMREIRVAVAQNRSLTAARDTDDYYRVDRLWSREYMGLQKAWQTEVHSYLWSLREAGETVVYVDICGRASGHDIGADRSYCFSRVTSKSRRMMHPTQNVIVDGDIMNMLDFYAFLELIKEGGTAPAFVTFQPIVGLESYTPSERRDSIHYRVTWQRLINNLQRLLTIMRPGGLIFLDRPFQLCNPDLAQWLRRPQPALKDYASVQWMREFCKEQGCSFKFARDITGMKFLLKK